MIILYIHISDIPIFQMKLYDLIHAITTQQQFRELIQPMSRAAFIEAYPNAISYLLAYKKYDILEYVVGMPFPQLSNKAIIDIVKTLLYHKPALWRFVNAHPYHDEDRLDRIFQTYDVYFNTVLHNLSFDTYPYFLLRVLAHGTINGYYKSERILIDLGFVAHQLSALISHPCIYNSYGPHFADTVLRPICSRRGGISNIIFSLLKIHRVMIPNIILGLITRYYANIHVCDLILDHVTYEDIRAIETNTEHTHAFISVMCDEYRSVKYNCRRMHILRRLLMLGLSPHISARFDDHAGYSQTFIKRCADLANGLNRKKFKKEFHGPNSHIEIDNCVGTSYRIMHELLLTFA